MMEKKQEMTEFNWHSEYVIHEYNPLNQTCFGLNNRIAMVSVAYGLIDIR